MAKVVTTDTHETLEPGDTVYIKMVYPEKRNMFIGRFDKLLQTFTKKGQITSVSKKPID